MWQHSIVALAGFLLGRITQKLPYFRLAVLAVRSHSEVCPRSFYRLCLVKLSRREPVMDFECFVFDPPADQRVQSVLCMPFPASVQADNTALVPFFPVWVRGACRLNMKTFRKRFVLYMCIISAEAAMPSPSSSVGTWCWKC